MRLERHLAAAPLRQRPRRDVGRPRRRHARPRRHGPRPRPARVEKGEAAKGVPFDRISNGAPGIETLLTMVHAGRAGGRLTLERMVDVLSTTPARLFGLERKGAIELGRDADLVLFDPAARRTIRAEDLHHTSDYTPYEGLNVAGAVGRSSSVAAPSSERWRVRRRARVRRSSSGAASGPDGDRHTSEQRRD